VFDRGREPKGRPTIQTQATAVDRDLPRAKCSALVFERYDVLIFCAVRICHPPFLAERNSVQSEKKLTSENDVDILEKFAKTSYAAEMVLDRLESSR
jgi:hypothetical protein